MLRERGFIFMKKNVRIVSACAAALLAMAPVITPLSTVNAADNADDAKASASVVAGDASDIQVTPGENDDVAATDVDLKLDITNAASLTNGASVSDATVSLSSNMGTAKLAKDAKVYIVKADTKITDVASVQKAAVKILKTGQKYKAVATGVGVEGLSTNQSYEVNTNLDDAKKQTTDNFGNIANIGMVVSRDFALPDSEIQGTPYFTSVDGGKVIDSAKADLNEDTVSAIIDAIKDTVKAHGGDTKNTEYPNYNLESAIKAQLQAGGMTVNPDGSFKPNAKTFTLTYTTSFANGKNLSIPITFTAKNFKAKESAPVISIKDSDKVEGSDGNFTWKNDVEQDSDLSADDILGAFEAKSQNDDKGSTKLEVKQSNLNTKVAGTYQVVLEATNDAGKSSQATVSVKVVPKKTDTKKTDDKKSDNKKDETNSKPVQATVQYKTDGAIAVYRKDGNKMIKTGLRIKNGAVLDTYGTVTVDGVSYSRVLSNTGVTYVMTKFLDGSYKPEGLSTKTVMHAAWIYNKNGKRANMTSIGAYSKLDVFKDLRKVGNTYVYKIGHNQYVKAGNLDGNPRKLTHNAYVYNSKGHVITLKKTRKVTKKIRGRKVTVRQRIKALIKKGKKLTTFGGSFKIGKSRFYRVGKGQYIKVANLSKAELSKAEAEYEAQVKKTSQQVAANQSANSNQTNE